MLLSHNSTPKKCENDDIHTLTLTMFHHTYRTTIPKLICSKASSHFYGSMSNETAFLLGKLYLDTRSTIKWGRANLRYGFVHIEIEHEQCHPFVSRCYAAVGIGYESGKKQSTGKKRCKWKPNSTLLHLMWFVILFVFWINEWSKWEMCALNNKSILDIVSCIPHFRHVFFLSRAQSHSHFQSRSPCFRHLVKMAYNLISKHHHNKIELCSIKSSMADSNFSIYLPCPPLIIMTMVLTFFGNNFYLAE